MPQDAPAQGTGTIDSHVAAGAGRALEHPADSYAVCFHDSAFVPIERAVVHVNSLAMRYGLSVFEGIRLYEQRNDGVRPFRLHAHVERLRRSLGLMQIEATDDDLPAVVHELIRINQVTEDAYVRVAVSPCTLGDIGSRGRSCLTVSISRMGRKPWLAGKRSMRVAISDWQRCPDRAFPAAAKNISSYAGPRLALLDARREGFDSGILTTRDGHLCESPTATLLLVQNGVVIGPPLSDGVLPGITRAAVFDLCRELGIGAIERHLSRQDAYSADEAFLCGTGIEFAPIGAFDRVSLPDVHHWKVMPRLVSEYFRIARGERADAAAEPSSEAATTP